MVPAPQRRAVQIPALAILALTLTGCSTLRTTRDRALDSDRWRSSVVSSARDPVTWVPAVGALVVSIEDWDEEISDWAREETPLFGSTDAAADASDLLKGATHVMMFVPLVFDEAPWREKLTTAALEQIAIVPAQKITGVLKEELARERPNERDRRSMPSGHSTDAFAYLAIARGNVRKVDWSPRTKRAFILTTGAFAIGTGWARVEAGEHYPTDVLVGSALGHFVTSVLHKVFIADEAPRLSVSPSRDGVEFRFSMRF
jgi:hypothetical protein